MNINILYRKIYSCPDEELLSVIEQYQSQETYNVYIINSTMFDMLEEFTYNLLHQAMQARRTKFIKLLLNQEKYNANTIDTYSGRYPLHTLTSVPNITNVYTLLGLIGYEKSVIVKYITKANEMKLSKSISIAIIKKILKGKLELTEDELLILDNEIRNDELQIADLLIEKGAIIDAPDSKGHMCLQYAIKNGSTDIVKLLLEKGANTKVEYYGLTIFELSVISRNLNTIKEVISKCGYDTDTDILCSVSSPEDFIIVKYLLDLGIDVNARNMIGETPLHRAIISGSRTN